MTSIYPATTAATTTASSTASSSVMRINGMSSGIDTDALVKSMLASYQTKIDKANQAEQTLGWQQDAYKSIITGIKGLQEYFDPLSAKYMLSGNSLNTNSIATSDSSVASGTALASANVGTYTVVAKQLAQQAKVEGTSLNSTINVADATKWGGASLTIGTSTITLANPIVDTNGNGTSLDEVVASINNNIAKNSNLSGTVSASYVNDTTGSYIKFTSTSSMAISTTASVANGGLTLGSTTANSGISTDTKLSDLGITTDLNFELSYNADTTTTPIQIDLSDTSTIQNLMDKVNSATSGAVTVGIDDTTGKISFQTKGTGSSTGLTIDNDTGNLSALGIVGATTATGITKLGQDALVTITAPGQAAVATTQSSNKFTSNGINYSLIGTGTSSLTVTSNTDTVVSNVKSFITDYNTIISTINTKLTEKPDPDYPPLTDAQKTTMSATQITAWETKSKVGILRNDDNLSSLLTQLRGTLYTPVVNSTTGNTACSFGSYGTNAVGIATTTDVTDGGQLVITDESKLRAAIEDNPDDFNKLFIGASTTTLPTTSAYVGSQTYKEDGIFQRMSKIITGYVSTPGIGTDGTFSLNGSMNIFVNKQYDFSSTGTSGQNTLPDQIYEKTLSITNLQTQMEAESTKDYAKFAAFEAAMSLLNSQQTTLTSMMSSTSTG